MTYVVSYFSNYWKESNNLGFPLSIHNSLSEALGALDNIIMNETAADQDETDEGVVDKEVYKLATLDVASHESYKYMKGACIRAYSDNEGCRTYAVFEFC